MSKIEYLPLDDPQDTNFGTYVPYFMFQRGLVRDGSATSYTLTGADSSVLYFEGDGFVFDQKGRPVEGHATTCTIVYRGEELATITDIDVKASKLAALDTAKEFYDLLGSMDIAGSAADDLMVGGLRDDTLTGGDGVDTLVGRKGDDRLFGGDGDDGLGVDEGKNILDGGAGRDIAQMGFDDDGVDLKIDLRETGFQKVGGGASVKLVSIEGAYGGDGDDRLTGDAQGNVFGGGLGKDSIVGNAGDDTIIGGLGDDTMKGGDGYDTLAFGSTNHGVTVSLAKDGIQNTGEGKDKFTGFENLAGSSYDDKLTGTAEFNHIEGGAGDDTLIGGGGQDGLFGGTGDDVFLFKGKVLGVANIADFNDGGDHDLIDLSRVDANVNLGGDQDFIFIGNGAFTGVAGQLRWQFFGNDATRDILISADTNGDGAVDFNIQLTSPVNALTGSDFDL